MLKSKGTHDPGIDHHQVSTGNTSKPRIPESRMKETKLAEKNPDRQVSFVNEGKKQCPEPGSGKCKISVVVLGFGFVNFAVPMELNISIYSWGLESIRSKRDSCDLLAILGVGNLLILALSSLDRSLSLGRSRSSLASRWILLQDGLLWCGFGLGHLVLGGLGNGRGLGNNGAITTLGCLGANVTLDTLALLHHGGVSIPGSMSPKDLGY